MAVFNISAMAEQFGVDYDAEWLEQGDHRTSQWLLVKSPMAPVTAALTYILVTVLGPRLMENRKPVQIGHVLTGYNAALVVLSAYMFYEFFMSAYLMGYGIGCHKVDYSDDPLALRMAKVCWVYYISKYVELADTIFFILRKKCNQITFLHVFHHSTMIVNWWLCVKYVPGGGTFFHAMLNSLVHTVMYLYYGLSAYGPALRPYLNKHKKHLTFLQLAQFAVVGVHTFHILFRCEFPAFFTYLALFYTFCMVTLFTNYFYREYVCRANARRLQQKRLQTTAQDNEPAAADDEPTSTLQAGVANGDSKKED